MTTPNIKAIDTRFDGHLFRSRLEARWAVFFKLINWDYEYETEGYELPSGRYLPDFYFPEVDCYAEVKPRPLNERERQLCIELSYATNDTPILQLIGPPECKSYKQIQNGGNYLDVVFVPFMQKYYPFFYTDVACPNYFNEIDAAAQKAREARFEFGFDNLK